MPKTVPIQLGEKTYDVEEMDLEQLEEFLSLQEPLREATTVKEQIGILARCLKVALMRAAPDITEREIKRSLTWSGISAAMSAATEVAGLVRAAPGEEQALPIGTASTRTSSTEQDGASTGSEG